MTKKDLATMSVMERRKYILNKFYIVLPFISILLLIGLWLFAATEGIRFPSPVQIWDRMIELFKNPVKNLNIFGHVLVSLQRISIALVFDFTVGLALGILVGWNRKFDALFSPLFDAFRAVPPLGWIPLITIWFGTGEFPKVLVVILGSIPCIVINAQEGIKNVNKLYIDVGKIFNANRWQMLFQIAIPSAMGAIFAGIRTAISAAWMVVLAAEMLGSKAGVGFLIVRGMDSLDLPLVFLSMIAIGIVGAILAFVTSYAERLICPWIRKSE